MSGNWIRGRTLLFLAVFAATIACSLLMARMGFLREASTILLFLPLLWAFAILRPAGMIISAVVLGVSRVLVEMIQKNATTGQWDVFSALFESAFPLVLYLAIGVAFYTFRRRQDVLVAKLIEAGTLETRERLAGSLAHDFNNILTVITGTAQMLLRDRSLDPRLQKDIQTIQDAGMQGVSLVQRMRQASRGAPEGFKPEDLADLIDRQMALVEKILPPNVHVVRHSSGPLPVQADKGEILRVVMNLCMNAKEVMPQGGVLTVRTGLEKAHGKSFAMLTISDTGPGIDQSLMARVFDPFFTTKTQNGNVGLGLSIVKSIASAHGGYTAAENLPGAGAAFHFCIPIDTAREAT